MLRGTTVRSATGRRLCTQLPDHPQEGLQETPLSCRTCTILYVWRLGVRFLLQLRASAGACECRTRCGPAEFTHVGASYATARSSAPFRYCFMEVGPVAGCCYHARRVSVCDRQQIKTAKAKRALRAGMGTANNANPMFKQQLMCHRKGEPLPQYCAPSKSTLLYGGLRKVCSCPHTAILSQVLAWIILCSQGGNAGENQVSLGTRGVREATNRGIYYVIRRCTHTFMSTMRPAIRCQRLLSPPAAQAWSAGCSPGPVCCQPPPATLPAHCPPLA